MNDELKEWCRKNAVWADTNNFAELIDIMQRGYIGPNAQNERIIKMQADLIESLRNDVVHLQAHK